MKKFFEILRKCNLFANIEDDNLISMLGCLGARVDLFDKKYTIFSEGSPAKYIGILLSGSAQIEKIDYYGNRNILSDIKPSEVFAEAFACMGAKSLPISVTANEPCEVMFIDCSRILHTCSKNCEFHQKLIFNLMQELASKTIMFQQKIEIMSSRTTRKKLMTYLMFYAKKVGSNSFDIPFNRQELADYLEVDRSGLSAEISKMKNEGIIESDRKHFKLL